MTAGVGSLAKRYAKALTELALAAEKSAAVAESVARFRQTWDTSPELRAAFSSPDLGQQQRKQLLETLGERLFLEPLVVRTLCLLSDRRRMALVPALADAYVALSEEQQGRVQAVVTTAAHLSEAYYEELEKALQDVTKKRVSIVRHVDPSLLGGVVTEVDGMIFDGSLRTRLDELEEELLPD